ncbi:MAG: hypothetical protein GY909_03950 [Oligoflexia bacterium]|nr:hypothetical protein [Oligoflexia bacterium]
MRSNVFIIFVIFNIFCFQVIADTKVCLNTELSVYCEDELEDYKSLNGSFYFNSQYYEFSSRRSFPGKWCESTVLNIQKVVQNGMYCMEFEENSLESELTINRVNGDKRTWSYFQ